MLRKIQGGGGGCTKRNKDCHGSRYSQEEGKGLDGNRRQAVCVWGQAEDK